MKKVLGILAAVLSSLTFCLGAEAAEPPLIVAQGLPGRLPGTLPGREPPAAPQPAAPSPVAGAGMPAACCNITAIDKAKSLVSARERASGRIVEFKVGNSAVLQRLQVGQAVHANFAAKQVSVDGKTMCCTITSVAAAPTMASKTPAQSMAAQKTPQSQQSPPLQKQPPSQMAATEPGKPMGAPQGLPGQRLPGQPPATGSTRPTVVNPAEPGGQGMSSTASGATSGSTKTKTTTGGGLGSIKTDTSNVKASEGDTATAMRGKPAHASDKRGATTQQSQGGQQAQVSSQTQAVNPDVIALQTTPDLVAKDLGFTGLGEITFNLVNRGEVGINVPKKQGGATTLGAQATSSGPPISIDIYMGTSKILTVQQPSMVGKQTKNFQVTSSNYSKPKCLETRNLKVVIDPQNQIKELHDDNNVTEANSARPCPDLAIKSIKRDYSGVLKETYSPKVTIINQGNAPSPSTVVWATSLPGEPWPVNGWPTLVPTQTIPALAPGQTTSFHTGGSVLSTNRTAVRIMLDRDFKIEESDESNNSKDERL